MKWLDDIPMPVLAMAALLLGLAPFAPEPHLVEKIRMLSLGVLSRPLDIFDLGLHASPTILLILKWARGRRETA